MPCVTKWIHFEQSVSWKGHLSNIHTFNFMDGGASSAPTPPPFHHYSNRRHSNSQTMLLWKDRNTFCTLQPPHRHVVNTYRPMYVLTCLMQYLILQTKQKMNTNYLFLFGHFSGQPTLANSLQLCSIAIIADMDDCTQMRPSLVSLVAKTALALNK